MARPLRIQFPGALYHVTSRGNARAPIFLGDSDRHLFLDVLGTAIDRCHWRCHAYCLMTNHYHLVLETPRANLSRGMRQLNGLYTQRFNRRHERVGHIFQGRFTGILVERESHLLELARYVVLNPVRAGMVPTADDYRWSSLRATLGLAPAPPWLTIRDLIAPFESRTRYRDFVAEGLTATSPWRYLRGSFLGSDDFVRRHGGPLDESTWQSEIPRRERLVNRERLEDLLPLGDMGRCARNDRIRRAVQTQGYTIGEIGRHLGLHYSTVSKIATAGESSAVDRSTRVQRSKGQPSCSALPSGDASNSQFKT
jgi:REP element-mobilizing transposase RayT